MPSASPLAGRLRDLRLRAGLTQGALGRALGVSTSLISSWEKGAVPAEHRLDDYARFFTFPQGGRLRLVGPEQMETAERRRYDDLRTTLLSLRSSTAAADEEVISPLRFGAGEPVTVVCSELPANRRAAFGNADLASADHIDAYRYADLDSLIALLPTVGANNPRSRITVGTTNNLSQDDLTAHLVLLGGVDWNPVTAAILDRPDHIPIRQLERDTDDDAGGFLVDHADRVREFTPRLTGELGAWTLVEDVALFLRAPNPYNAQRTLTMFNGSFSRGTLGIVRSMTDHEFHRRNAAYVARRFAGAETYGILCRVEIVALQVVIPDWTLDSTRLYEWPERHP